MGWGNQHGELGNFKRTCPSFIRSYCLVNPFPCSPTLPRRIYYPHPACRVLWEEVLVAAFEYIHLRIVEAGVVVGGSVSFPDEAAPGTRRGVVRAGCAVGVSGDLLPAPTPLGTTEGLSADINLGTLLLPV